MTHQKDDMDTASKPDAAPAGRAVEALRELVEAIDRKLDRTSEIDAELDRAEAVLDALAAAPVVPPSLLGAPPAGSGSAASGPSPSVSALRAPIPGADARDAARYRWLRDVAWNNGQLIYFETRYGDDEWDERIDAALARGMEARQGRDPQGLDGAATTARSAAPTRPEDRADGADQSNSGETT